MKTTICKCFVCGKEFKRCLSEVNRSKRKNANFYCSHKCCGKNNYKHLPSGINIYNKDVCKKKSDIYSPFRIHHKCAKKRNKHFDITLEDLKNQWEKQKGICPYTGWRMTNAPCQSPEKKIERTPNRASLDRIDSNKGYTVDNIQFVSLMAQYAKNSFSEEELFTFCEAVTKNSVAFSATE